MSFVRQKEKNLAVARNELNSFLQKYRDVAISYGEASITIEDLNKLESLFEDVECAQSELTFSEAYR